MMYHDPRWSQLCTNTELDDLPAHEYTNREMYACDLMSLTEALVQ
jgi:hypothetical protein